MCQTHNKNISIWLVYSKSRSEFCFALNIKNELTSCVLLSFVQQKQLLCKLFHPYLIGKCTALSVKMKSEMPISNHRQFWMETFNHCLGLKVKSNSILEWLFEIRDIFNAINSTCPYSKWDKLQLYKNLKSLKMFTTDFELYIYIICCTYVYAINKDHSEGFIKKFNELIHAYNIIEESSFHCLFE